MVIKDTDKWMQSANKEMKAKGTVGALRKELDAKPGKPIPEKKLEKAAHSKNPLEKKRAVMAENMKKSRKK